LEKREKAENAAFCENCAATAESPVNAACHELGTGKTHENEDAPCRSDRGNGLRARFKLVKTVKSPARAGGRASPERW
jgi:hypothetical protein